MTSRNVPQKLLEWWKLRYDQQVEYEVCILRADNLDNKVQIFGEKIWFSLEEAKKESAKYKELSEGAKVYAIKEATMLADVMKFSKDLEWAKENHEAYAKMTDREILRLREELQLVKDEQFFTSKDLENARNEMASVGKRWAICYLERY